MSDHLPPELPSKLSISLFSLIKKLRWVTWKNTETPVNAFKNSKWFLPWPWVLQCLILCRDKPTSICLSRLDTPNPPHTNTLSKVNIKHKTFILLYFKWGGSYVDWLDCTPQSLFGSFLSRVLPTQDSTCGQGGDRQVAGLQAQGEEQSDQDPGVVCPAPPAPWSPLGFLSPSPLCWCTEPKTLLPVRY